MDRALASAAVSHTIRNSFGFSFYQKTITAVPALFCYYWLRLSVYESAFVHLGLTLVFELIMLSKISYMIFHTGFV